MPILYRTQCRDRLKILQSFYPFAHPEQINGMLIGNDLDALLSAQLLKEYFGWDIIGIYDYHNLWYAGDPVVFRQNLLASKILAVDLDIYHPQIASLGHHILQVADELNLGQQLSLNPNFIRGVNLQTFRRKYPLGTIHFLSWLLDLREVNRETELLIWLADSAFINGQRQRFRENVQEWIEIYFDFQPFRKVFQELDSRAFEVEIQTRILPNLNASGLGNAKGQVSSRHLGISGFQCQWHNPNRACQNVIQLFRAIQEITGWERPNFPDHFFYFKGCRKSISLNEMQKKYSGFSNFLKAEEVFSYAIYFNRLLNFTGNLKF
jgi:hypothetical protein